MGCFSIDKTALKTLINKMDTKIYEYSKHIAKLKVEVRSNKQNVQDVTQTANLNRTEEMLCFLQDSIDCFILLREYCSNLLQQVTDIDRMNAIFLNSCALKLQKFGVLANDTVNTLNESMYVTDSNGNKFYRALYSDLTPKEIEQLSMVIGKETVRKLCAEQT